MVINTETYFNGDEWVYKHSLWTVDSVCQTCITHQYYTKGNNEDYAKLLDYVRDFKPTIKTMFIAARNIYQHSTIKDDIDEYDGIALVMDVLQREAVSTVFTIFSEEVY